MQLTLVMERIKIEHISILRNIYINPILPSSDYVRHDARKKLMISTNCDRDQNDI